MDPNAMNTKRGALMASRLYVTTGRMVVAGLVMWMALCGVASSANAVTIDWVTVGDPGNANDPATGNLYGAVAEEFRIMKFEWTNSQYTQFLNAIDPDGTNPSAVYNPSMGSNARGGISFDANASSGSKYAVRTNMGNKPVSYVNWFDVARVANWLHNGGLNYGSTDFTANAPQNTGAYTLGTVTSGTAPAKNAGALYWIPTENEWYKAAYYDPTLNSGAGGYTIYGNGFSWAPTAVTATEAGDGTAGQTGNFANFGSGAIWGGLTNVTTVGTNGAPSYYGAFDMSGNVWEWNDRDGTANLTRGLRGGSWDSPTASPLSSSFRPSDPSGEGNYIGFRLAAVPEPATLGLASGGALCACGWWVLKRRRRA